MAIWTKLAEQHGAPEGLTIGQAFAYLDNQREVNIQTRLSTGHLHVWGGLCKRYCGTPGVREIACTEQEFEEAQTWEIGRWLIDRGILYVAMD